MPGTDRSAEIRLSAYDPAWPAKFAAERERLIVLLGPWLAGPIEHIGSTAVPGLIAKPVIDIMAGVRDLESSRPAIVALRALDYHYAPYRPDLMHWFCKPHSAHRTHHLHLVPIPSPLWFERLGFRDQLRAQPETALQYAELKRALARRFAHDREAYTDAKAAFVNEVVARALAPRSSGGS